MKPLIVPLWKGNYLVRVTEKPPKNEAGKECPVVCDTYFQIIDIWSGLSDEERVSGLLQALHGALERERPQWHAEAGSSRRFACVVLKIMKMVWGNDFAREVGERLGILGMRRAPDPPPIPFTELRYVSDEEEWKAERSPQLRGRSVFDDPNIPLPVDGWIGDALPPQPKERPDRCWRCRTTEGESNIATSGKLLHGHYHSWAVRRALHCKICHRLQVWQQAVTQRLVMRPYVLSEVQIIEGPLVEIYLMKFPWARLDREDAA